MLTDDDSWVDELIAIFGAADLSSEFSLSVITHSRDAGNPQVLLKPRTPARGREESLGQAGTHPNRMPWLR